MAQTQLDPSPPPSPPASPAEDHLSHLHKMSTTAGLGSTDYVAVNSAAVASLLLGLASSLTLLEEFLLVIPLVCVVVSVIAWRKIAGSNGTETGKGLVIAGLVCALGFGGFVIARKATEGARTREDRHALGRTITELGEKVKAGDFTAAYGMFSERFAQRVPRQQFDERIGFLRESELYGKLKQTSWNGLVEFTTDDATNTRYATTKVIYELEKTSLDDTLTFRKTADGRWIFEGMAMLFPPPQR